MASLLRLLILFPAELNSRAYCCYINSKCLIKVYDKLGPKKILKLFTSVVVVALVVVTIGGAVVVIFGGCFSVVDGAIGLIVDGKVSVKSPSSKSVLPIDF